MAFIKKLTLIIAVFVLSQNKALFADTPDTCLIGTYITSLYDLSLSESSFKVDFWLWLNYKNDSSNFSEAIEIQNAKEYSFSLHDLEKKSGINWATQKCKATIKKDWDIKNFPFEKQNLEIIIEDANNDVSSLIYKPDTKNSKFHPSVNINGWKIVDFNIKTIQNEYQTTYGDPVLKGSSTYSRASINFVIKRDAWGLFFKLFTGVFIAFIISILVFFIDPLFVDPRFGLSVGALFAAVGNKYIVDSILPESTTITLVDKIHNITFEFIFISILVSVISLRLSKNKKLKLSKKLDSFAFMITSVFYISMISYMIYSATT